MKVNIGPYTTWVGPYQVAQYLCFWAKDKDEYGLTAYPDWVHEFGKILAHGFKKNEERKTLLYKFLDWVESKKKRKIKVHIDRYDVWNADDTLALIILPLLTKLKEVKHGCPLVDDEDVPEELRSTNAPPKKNEWDWDDNNDTRWDWVLDEIIWTFTQLHPDCDWENQYYSGEVGEIDFNEEKVSSGITLRPLMFKNSTFKADHEGLKQHSEKISNGLRLFGKYYRSLWD